MTDGQARDWVRPGAIAVALALVVVAVGFTTYGLHPSRFLHAGTYFVAPRDHLVLQKGAGYDGQFLYRLALAPFDLRTQAQGIRFDTPLRLQRIGVPLLAWALSGGGRPAALPYAFLVIEVGAVGAVGALGGLVARRFGRPALWGVLLAGQAALVFSVLHDLTEPPEIALLLGALLLWWRARPVAAGSALAAAVLTRETALLLALAIALPRVLSWLRGGRPSRLDAAWVLPGLAFVGWTSYVWADTGRSPLAKGGGDNLGPPFAGVVGLIRELPRAAWHEWPLLLVQLTLLVWILVLVVPVLRAAPGPLPLAVGLYGLLALCGSTVVWTGYDDLRFAVELSTVALVALLASPRRLVGLAVGSGLVWLVSLAINRQ